MKITGKSFPRLLAAKIYVRYVEDKDWRRRMINSVEPYRFSIWECGFLTEKQCEKLDPLAPLTAKQKKDRRYEKILNELEHMFATKAAENH